MPVSDDDLRVMLHERAASIPEAPERLESVHRRIRRERKRSSLLAAGGSAVVVALVATVVGPRLAPDPARIDTAVGGSAVTAATSDCSSVDVSAATTTRGAWQLTGAWTTTTTAPDQEPSWSPVPAESVAPVDPPRLDAASSATVELQPVVDGLRDYGVPFGTTVGDDTPPDSVGDADDYVYYSGVRLGEVRFTGRCESSGVPVSGDVQVYTNNGGGILQCSLPLPKGPAFAAGTWAAQAARFCPVGSRASR